jgi:subtilisin family serine protease
MKLRLFIAFIAALAASWAAEPVRYIVELTTEPAIALKVRDRGARREAIGREHASVERAMRSTARNATVVAKLSTAINALIVDGDSDDLARLSSLPGVKRVTISRDLKLHLDRALNIHQVKPAWETSGTRGKGVKIGILDTGIQANHPAFRAPADMALPAGFPIASSGGNLALTSNKIIVARTFEVGRTVADTYGHGTATAMIAAGVEHNSPSGVISGFAPDAYLGIYKVARWSTNTIPTDFVVQALDAAAADGMEVLNISLGSIAFDGFPADSMAEAVNRIAEAGIIVVNSAGNDGPEMMTLDGSASAPLVIGVGSAQTNRAIVSPAIVLPDGSTFDARASSDSSSTTPNVDGVVIDVAQFDSTKLLCDRVADEVFLGKIPLIQRGTCNFTVKLKNAYLSGATTAIVYNRPDDTDPNSLVTMSVDDAPSIPGLFISYDNGAKLIEAAAAGTEETPYLVQARFVIAGDPNKLSSFSSLGPSIDYTIKPDLVATGSSVYTAGQTEYWTGGLYTTSGYVTTSGTSFSAPMVAGAAAVIKAARPGLWPEDYRSLLINTARPMTEGESTPMDVMKAGAGSLNLDTAIKTSLVARPVSVSFGLQKGPELDLWKQVIVKNIAPTTRTYTLELQSANEVKPILTDSTLTLDSDQIAGPLLGFMGTFEPGNYQGFLVIRDDETQVEIRIPYWLAVETGVPVKIAIPVFPENLYVGGTARYYLRLHDKSGVVVTGITPEATVTQGNTTIRRIGRVADYPGLWYMDIQVGSTTSTIEITGGEAKRTVTVSPQ